MSETPLANPSGHSISYEAVLRSTSPTPRRPRNDRPQRGLRGSPGVERNDHPRVHVPIRQHPEGGARKRGSTPAAGTTLTDRSARPPCAPVAVRHPNHPRSGSSLRVVPSGVSSRPLARQTRPKHR